MARAGKQKGSAHPNVEAAVRGWQNHEYADTGAAMDALERGNSHLYEEMYPDVDAKTARTRFRKLINAQLAKPEVSRSKKPEELVPMNGECEAEAALEVAKGGVGPSGPAFHVGYMYEE